MTKPILSIPTMTKHVLTIAILAIPVLTIAILAIPILTSLVWAPNKRKLPIDFMFYNRTHDHTNIDYCYIGKTNIDLTSMDSE